MSDTTAVTSPCMVAPPFPTKLTAGKTVFFSALIDEAAHDQTPIVDDQRAAAVAGVLKGRLKKAEMF